MHCGNDQDSRCQSDHNCPEGAGAANIVQAEKSDMVALTDFTALFGWDEMPDLAVPPTYPQPQLQPLKWHRASAAASADLAATAEKKSATAEMANEE